MVEDDLVHVCDGVDDWVPLCVIDRLCVGEKLRLWVELKVDVPVALVVIVID